MSDRAGIPMEDGELKGSGDLLPMIYEELRRLAAHKLANEDAGHTLQPTALVHEAWLRLAPSQQVWRDRKHFFGAAAEAMRRVLIDQVRRKASIKRGSNQAAEELHESRIEWLAPSDEALAVHGALDELAKEDAVSAEVVKLRYFVGMSVEEIGAALELSPRSVDRHWAFARAWLQEAIRRDLRG